MNVLGVGEKTPFTVRAYPGYPSPTLDYSPIDVSRQGQWVSSDPGVATVSSDGLLAAGTPGTTEILVTYKGASYTVPLLVAGNGSSQSLSRYVGTWSGEATMTCQRLSGVGRNVCDRAHLTRGEIALSPGPEPLRQSTHLDRLIE